MASSAQKPDGCSNPSARVQWSAAVMRKRIFVMGAPCASAGVSVVGGLLDDVAVGGLDQAGELAATDGPQVDETRVRLQAGLGHGVVMAADEDVVTGVVELLGHRAEGAEFG